MSLVQWSKNVFDLWLNSGQHLLRENKNTQCLCEVFGVKCDVFDLIARYQITVCPTARFFFGSAKPSTKERRNFYHTALGSLREVQLHLKILDRKDLIKDADILGAHIYCLCKNTR